MLSKIIAIFLTWRISLFIIAFIASLLLPQFGNRFPYADQVLKVTGLPAWVWGFGNFDGVHYLRIAQNGYDAEFSQAFFPLYPLLIRFVADSNLFLQKDTQLDTRIYVDPGYFFSGLILANLFFLLALVFFYKLVRIDFNHKIAFGSLLLLVSFPTSLYFGSIYTESLFLFLVLGALYFARKGNFIAAGVFSALASATRFFGLFLVPVLLIEGYLKLKKGQLLEKGEMAKTIIGILLAPFGSLFYFLFLRLNFDNPLYFLTSQSSFGAERSAEKLIFLPQVLFRYLKIFITVPVASQLYLNAVLEFIFTIAAFLVLILFIKKIRLSYLIFTLGCLIMPTLTGTLSSMPRYVLMSFLLLPFIVQGIKGKYKLLLILFIGIGAVLLGFFVRGYWIA
jgi:Gpi18-like mannosyltransferase